MAGPSPSASSKYPMKYCKSSRVLSTPRFTALSSKGGFARNGAKPRLAAPPSSIRSLQPDARSSIAKGKTGPGSPPQSTSLSTACNQEAQMRILARFRMLVLSLFHRKAETARLDDELQFHLDQQVAENIARGLTPDEARAAAMRSFGNPSLLREQARSTWSWSWLETILRDIRYGARTLTRSPGFTLISILVMALGIGATTSLFTIVRAVLLKPLPFAESDKLVAVYEHFRESNGGDGFNVVAPADFRDWHQQTHGFQDMAAWRRYGFDLTGEHAELPEVV